MESTSSIKARLDARIRESKDHEKYKFGAPKSYLHKSPSQLFTKPVNDKPNFIYK